MAANEPFKATAYQVGRIPKAMSSDVDGNLIFADVPNPAGVTLTELLEGLLSGKIKFNTDGTFFTGVENVQDALKYLNQFAYLKDTGHFILVDSTIDKVKEVDGEIYQSLDSAITWINGQILNGYNIYNVILMGSHKTVTNLEQTTDFGAYEISSGTSLKITNNGIKILGVGNPVIRIKNVVGTEITRKDIFVIDTDGVNNNISVSFENIGIEIVDSVYTSVFHVKNAPISNITKERSGFSLKNTSVSFVSGLNTFNRLVDFSNDGTQLVSNVIIDGIKLGSIANTIPSESEIQLVYIDHHAESVTNIKNINFGLAQQPNPIENVDPAQTTSFTGMTVLNGKVIADSITLDEKFYWNGGLFSNTVTKLLKTFNAAEVTISNISIARSVFNMASENTGGITNIKDWIVIAPTSQVNIDGFDTYLNVDVVVCGSSGTSGTPTSGTSGTSGTSDINCDVKPVKGVWNKDKLSFGWGHKGEVRFGKLKNADLIDFTTYSLTYGVPFWYNEDVKGFQYWDGLQIVTLGLGSGGGASAKTYIGNITALDFTATSYTYAGEATFLGFEYNLAHNLLLSNKNAYTLSLVETSTGRKIEPQEVVSVNINTMRIVLSTPQDVTITLIGF